MRNIANVKGLNNSPTLVIGPTRRSLFTGDFIGYVGQVAEGQSNRPCYCLGRSIVCLHHYRSTRHGVPLSPWALNGRPNITNGVTDSIRQMLVIFNDYSRNVVNLLLSPF